MALVHVVPELLVMRVRASRRRIVQLVVLVFVTVSGGISGFDASLPRWLRVTHGALGIAAAAVAVRVAWTGTASASSRTESAEE